MPLDNVTAYAPIIPAVDAPDAALEFRTRLYLGRMIPASRRYPGGPGLVSDYMAGEFVAHVVAAEFPSGFTIISAEGGWRDATSGAHVREPALIVEVMHSADGFGSLRRVAEGWKDQYQQDAVMSVTERVAVSFL